MSTIRPPALEVSQPLPHRPNLPQMRLLDELRLSVQIQNTITIPMMPRASNQILRMKICRIPRRRIIRVIADVEPNVNVAINEGQTIRREIEISVIVVVSQIGRAGYGIVLSLRKSPFAPLLGVVDLEDAGDQRGSGCGRDLVGALFRAGAVEVAAGCGVGCVGVECLILSAETGCTVDWDTVTEWEEGLFHVLGVIAKVSPSFAVAVFTEDSVDRCDVFRGIQVGDVGAEMEEILGAVC